MKSDTELFERSLRAFLAEECTGMDDHDDIHCHKCKRMEAKIVELFAAALAEREQPQREPQQCWACGATQDAPEQREGQPTNAPFIRENRTENAEGSTCLTCGGDAWDDTSAAPCGCWPHQPESGENPAPTAPSGKYCMYCGKPDHASDKHPKIPGPALSPRFYSCCGVEIQRSVGGAISYGKHKDDCPKAEPAPQPYDEPTEKEHRPDCAIYSGEIWEKRACNCGVWSEILKPITPPKEAKCPKHEYYDPDDYCPACAQAKTDAAPQPFYKRCPKCGADLDTEKDSLQHACLAASQPESEKPTGS